ncbi:MAG TPA: type II toxin-antitoxin system PemK/MazF family toxin [bacterium]
MTKYNFGEIVIIDFPQSGLIQRKRCPTLIILDIGDFDVILAPITTRERLGPGDYKIRDWHLSGLLRESWVRLAKVSCLEKSDISLRLGMLTAFDKDRVKKLWQRLYAFQHEIN